MEDLKTMVLEAVHSFLAHSPYVSSEKQIKWADTMLSAVKVIEGDSESLPVFREDLRIMIYKPIDSIAEVFASISETSGLLGRPPAIA